ncbi:MAG: DoxX family protein [Pseudomonadales bacterium]|nr:DoxX family protein [Pseudomonadales bacterium]MCP5358512.1 DoxX family protein [Pseudomonadales bacterium]
MSYINTILATDKQFSPLALRLPMGIIFVAHGAQKLFGAFGGYGLEGTGQFMESIGLTPGVLMAGAAGSAEFFGGLLLIVGLLTRPAAAALAVTMVVAILSVHIGNGLFMDKGGYEFGLALLAGTVSLLISGAGRLSVDNAWSRYISRAATPQQQATFAQRTASVSQ